MQLTIRHVFALLSASAFLVGCDNAIVDPPTGDTSVVRRNIPPEDTGESGGGGGGGGGPAIPPFNPPAPPYIFAQSLTAPGAPGPGPFACGQVTHAFWGVNGGWSNDVTQGTIINVTGVVSPGTPMHWGVYNQAGTLLKDRWTNNSGSNCVVAHEPETISTADLAPGYYFLYASYVGLFTLTGQESSASTPQPIFGKYVGAIRVR